MTERKASPQATGGKPRRAAKKATAKKAAPAKPAPAKTEDASAPEVEATAAAGEAIINPGLEQGFVGAAEDSTPDEHYSIAGVLAGKPTPENP